MGDLHHLGGVVAEEQQRAIVVLPAVQLHGQAGRRGAVEDGGGLHLAHHHVLDLLQEGHDYRTRHAIELLPEGIVLPEDPLRPGALLLQEVFMTLEQDPEPFEVGLVHHDRPFSAGGAAMLCSR